jgi:hypothetical protein
MIAIKPNAFAFRRAGVSDALPDSPIFCPTLRRGYWLWNDIKWNDIKKKWAAHAK